MLAAAKHARGRARRWRGRWGREKLQEEVLVGLDPVPQGPPRLLHGILCSCMFQAQTWAFIWSHRIGNKQLVDLPHPQPLEMPPLGARQSA